MIGEVLIFLGGLTVATVGWLPWFVRQDRYIVGLRKEANGLSFDLMVAKDKHDRLAETSARAFVERNEAIRARDAALAKYSRKDQPRNHGKFGSVAA